MASDYGDEAGGKLLDWMLRIGQEAGAEAMARPRSTRPSASWSKRRARPPIAQGSGSPR